MKNFLHCCSPRRVPTCFFAEPTVLNTLRTLLELDLSGCGGTDASFRAVTKAAEANTTLGVLLCADNHLSNDSVVEIEYAMGRPKSTVRELVGQVRSIFPAVACEEVEL